jgi:hypothetical protein
MAGNDEAGDSKPPDPGPLSLDDAERLASQFTPLWEEAPEPTAAPPPEPPDAPVQPSPFANLTPVQLTPPDPPPASTPEPTPAMVAIARPMGSSPDIDPSSTELPDRRSDYAPPRPLAVPQRTMVGLAPPPPVQVAPSATTTPLGLTSAPPVRPALEVVAEARPALQVVAEPSGLGLRNAVDEDDDDLLPRPKRKTGLVLGVMGVAVALVAAVGIRSLFVKRDTSIAPPQFEAAHKIEPVRTAAPPSPVEQAAPPAAAPVASAEPPPAGEPAPTASAVSGENSAVAAAPSPAGIQLAATRQAAEGPTANTEPAKPRTPQRVEEAKRTTHVARPAPRRQSTPKPPASPPLPGGGAIVRQSPF